jgi:hypothetical protein
VGGHWGQTESPQHAQEGMAGLVKAGREGNFSAEIMKLGVLADFID